MEPLGFELAGDCKPSLINLNFGQLPAALPFSYAVCVFGTWRMIGAVRCEL